MTGALAEPFQFLVAAELVGPFPFGQLSAGFPERNQPVLPQKEPVDGFRMIFAQGHGGVKAAYRQFIGKFIPHIHSIPGLSRNVRFRNRLRALGKRD
jgi:hypothetical protein